MTRASDTAKLIGAGATILDGTTITTDDNTAQLELVSTDADSGIGPHQVFYRNSSSPADSDLLCELDFRGRNDNSQDVNYATVNVKANDVTDGEEDGEYILQVMTAGSADTTMHIKPAEIVFNEDSIDRDFRVESNGQSHLLFVDGGNDCLLINNSTRNNLGVVELLTTIGVDNAMIIKTPESGTSGTATAIKFRYNGSTSGTISYTGSSTSYATSSDYRLKENVTYDFDATSRLKQLKPSRFNFIADKDTIVDGFLAHEVSNIVPEAITGDKDETENIDNVVLNANGTINSSGISQSDWTAGKSDETYASDTTWVASKTVPKYQGIDQSKLVPLLVKTIQELEARITTLENA
jgi:hypothetical protein